MCSQQNNDQEKKASKLSGRQQVRIKQNSRSPHERIIYYARGSKTSRMKTRIRKEKINKRKRVREEEELTEEWPDGLKNETKCRRISA